jgi:hypothetical protein
MHPKVCRRSVVLNLHAPAGDCCYLVVGSMRKVLLPVHAQQVALLAFNQHLGPLVVLWWMCAPIRCSCGVLLCALVLWCPQGCWVVGTVRKVLLPVCAQQVVLLAFYQLFRPLGVLWWLCACVGCSCNVLLVVEAPYCCCMGTNDCPLLISSKTGLCW